MKVLVVITLFAIVLENLQLTSSQDTSCCCSGGSTNCGCSSTCSSCRGGCGSSCTTCSYTQCNSFCMNKCASSCQSYSCRESCSRKCTKNCECKKETPNSLTICSGGGENTGSTSININVDNTMQTTNNVHVPINISVINQNNVKTTSQNECCSQEPCYSSQIRCNDRMEYIKKPYSVKEFVSIPMKQVLHMPVGRPMLMRQPEQVSHLVPQLVTVKQPIRVPPLVEVPQPVSLPQPVVIPQQTGWVVDDAGCRTPDKGVGDCIKIFDCQPMTNFLTSKQQFSQEEIAALLSYQCGVDNNTTKVCCPNEPITLDWLYESTEACMDVKDCKIIYDYIKNHSNFSTEIKEALRKYACNRNENGSTKVRCPKTLPPEFVQAEGLADDSQHVNYKLLPNSCGISENMERIINGNLTSLYEFPWAVALKYDRKNKPYACGGTLINSRYILTAAHCIYTSVKLIGVRIGEHNFDTDPDCQGSGDERECAAPHQDFEVDLNDTIPHENYNSSTFHNDIALIRLRRLANTTVFSASPICLPITFEQKMYNVSNYTAIGWGITEENTSSPILLRVLLSKEDMSKCTQKYASFKKELTDNQMCAGGKNRDTCAGDSGGPLSAEYASNGHLKVIQYGIVSFGHTPCGTNDLPGVYTRVDKYTKWILDHLKP